MHFLREGVPHRVIEQVQVRRVWGPVDLSEELWRVFPQVLLRPSAAVRRFVLKEDIVSRFQDTGDGNPVEDPRL